MKRWVGALAFLGIMATASSAMAQEVQIRGPLAGAPSCRHCVQYRAGRFIVAPSVGFTLQDEFSRTLFTGAQLHYHFSDIIGVGVYGAYAPVHLNTDLTNDIQTAVQSEQDMGRPATSNIPQGNQFSRQIGQMNWMAALQLTIVPLRGKLSLFQNIFVDTDFYVFGGPAVIGVEERANVTAEPGTTASAESQLARSSRLAFTGTFGVGLNFYITKFLSLGVEYRAFPFARNTAGTDESSSLQTCGEMNNESCAGFPDQLVQRGRFVIDETDRQFAWNQMVNVYLNIFLPFQPRVSP